MSICIRILMLVSLLTGFTRGENGTEVDMSVKDNFVVMYNNKHGDDKPKIEHDKAWLTVNSSVNFILYMMAQTEECHNCPMQYVSQFRSINATTILVNTTFVTRVTFVRVHPTKHVEDICSFETKFRESGDYWVFLDYESYTDGSLCHLTLSNDPAPAEMPILYTFVGLIALAALWTLISRIYSRARDANCCGQSANITDPMDNGNVISLSSITKDPSEVENGVVATSTEKSKPEKKKERLRCLDTLRGISLVVMIFVNYGGGGYWFFEHPPWNGLSVADLVFPWFIFIMGTSMNFSFKSMHKRQKTSYQIIFKICKRSFILFALGIILNTSWGPVDLETMRIPGVLQRFGVTYLFLALMEFFLGRREDSHQEAKWAPIRDIVLSLPMWILNLAILAVFIGLTYALPVPGCPTGYTGPGGISDGGKHVNCTAGAAQYIDKVVLGENHIYQYPTPQVIYQTSMAHDPEGILGVLTSVFLCFLGLVAGRIIITFEGHASRVIRWLIWAAITGGIGALLCKGSQNDGWIPVNKNLWSVSFIMVTACFAFILLSVLYIVMDVLKWWKGGPFVYPGMNSIVIYVCHGVFWREFPINWQLEPVHWKLLLQDVWGTSIWIFVAYLMYRKRFFVAI
ncbi:heparan-alpha-glucosaminide N-acetyltransferase [Patella vulgata]|uniref:heparan-alpha-glucosaminide N-acetyltransferase n=1 Tax=Patella vulgata TaxID=6465 RepID=UPI00217F9054|nr:heparan-alpha-glucosaminide N-acetyltransferase [Patella vulgata]